MIKLVPVVGGVVGGTIDVGSTKLIAKNAYKIFIMNEISSNEEEIVIDAEDVIEIDDDLTIGDEGESIGEVRI